MWQHLTEVLGDWRFPSAVVLVGSFAGGWVYRWIPAPRGTREHVGNAMKAAAASHMAGRAGLPQVEAIADVVGVAEMGAVHRDLRRQRRACLVGTVCGATVILLPVCMYVPVSLLPDWVFGVAAALGVVRLCQLWR